jgi:plasmid stabilization system protein ParE
MPRRISYTDDALTDLEAIFRRLTHPGAGRRAALTRQRMDDALDDLLLHPLMWAVGDHPGVRERPVDGYRIMYEVSTTIGSDRAFVAGDVMVLRVFSPAMNRTRLF